ncbi:3'(2'),5'-bisphosphate nucleotidase CysQ [Clostridia bacterium]|nr:3'(2'),5'-bisphosphate nucleotidase CysQ [Clostridia bacterium]
MDCMTGAAKKAARAIMDVYQTDFHVDMKEDNSPLTLADRRANDIIVSVLEKAYPEYAILSEEGRDNPARLLKEYCFVVDPLDGTKEFVKRNGQFTVNIALCRRGYPIAGLIYVPVTKELYYASECNGAVYKNMGTGITENIQVSERKTSIRVVCSRSHVSEEEQKLYLEHKAEIQEIKPVGSSLKGCLVARGHADVYYRYGFTSEWDTAAMQCIVEEAGGIFRQMDGSIMHYNREDSLNRKGFYIVNRKENIWL